MLMQMLSSGDSYEGGLEIFQKISGTAIGLRKYRLKLTLLALK